MSADRIAAADLRAGQTYRDDLGNYREIRSITKTRSFVVVVTQAGRYIFRKTDRVALAGVA